MPILNVRSLRSIGTISKTNFKAAIERQKSSHGLVQVSSVNLCSDITINNRSEPPLRRKDRNDKSPKYPLEVPELLPFYRRTRELTQLKEWIVNGGSRTILIHGISGSGKTALARQLLEKISPQFDRIIWQSLGCQRPLTEFLDRNIIPSFTQKYQRSNDSIWRKILGVLRLRSAQVVSLSRESPTSLFPILLLPS